LETKKSVAKGGGKIAYLVFKGGRKSSFLGLWQKKKFPFWGGGSYKGRKKFNSGNQLKGKKDPLRIKGGEKK